MANSFIYSLLTPTIQSTAARVKENFCIPRRKLVAFKIDKDSPNGIKLRDISSGACSTYEGTDLRGILQHATYDEGAGEHFFPGDALACFESSHSERLFYGHNDTLYPVQHLKLSGYAALFLHRALSVLHREYSRVIVLKTDFIVGGSHADEVIFEGSAPSRGMRRLRLFVPDVETRDTKDMNPTRVALLSPRVVPYDSKSLFLRRYVALIVASISKYERIIPALLWDIYKNAEQLTYITAHKRGILSDPDAEFLSRIVGFAQNTVCDSQFQCDRTARSACDGYISLLLGLSQSEEAMFRPMTERGRLWLISEFIRSDRFQSAVTALALASVGHSLNTGVTFKDRIMANMPYLCRQIPGLCEAVYAMVKIATNGAYEQGSLSNLVLYRARRANRELSVLPNVDAELAFEGMSGEAEIQRFESLVNSAMSALLTDMRGNTTDTEHAFIRGLARNVLRSSRSADIIATLTICNIQRLRTDTTLLLDAVSTDIVAGDMIAEYVLEEAQHDPEIASGAVLKLANRQKCEIFCDAETCIYPGGIRCERARSASGTLLQSPVIAAVVESTATGLVREAY
ncbi:MAG: hypothetical protein AB8U40_03010 [Anaplasma ovis]